MLADGSSASSGGLCVSFSFPSDEAAVSPSFHASHYAGIVQPTGVSNPASLCCCSTSLVLTTQASLALSAAEMQQDFFSSELAWQHSGNEQGLNGGHAHFAGLAVCSPP